MTICRITNLLSAIEEAQDQAQGHRPHRGEADPEIILEHESDGMCWNPEPQQAVESLVQVLPVFHLLGDIVQYPVDQDQK